MKSLSMTLSVLALVGASYLAHAEGTTAPAKTTTATVTEKVAGQPAPAQAAAPVKKAEKAVKAKKAVKKVTK